MGNYDDEVLKWNQKSMDVLASKVDWTMDGDYDSVFRRRNVLRPVHAFFDGIDRPNIRVLDYGCGAGWTAIRLARKAEHVSAFDIAPKRIEMLNKYAEANKVDNVEAIVANGEQLPYADDHFDYVFGNAILHHLPLDLCLAEIARVLKPGGRAAFCEPLAHNPLINFYRYIKHHHVEEVLGTDRPLRFDDIDVFEANFDHVKFIESSFTNDRYPKFFPIERFFLRAPLLKKLAAYVTVLLEGPISRPKTVPLDPVEPKTEQYVLQRS